MADPRVAHCIFCDDIRLELGGKYSIMGIYSGQMFVASSPPATLPRFGIVAWLIADVDDIPERVTWTVHVLPELGQVVQADVQVSDITIVNMDGATKVYLQVSMPMSSFVIPQEGSIEVWVETETGRIRAGRLVVMFNPEDDAMPPTGVSAKEPVSVG